MEIRMELAQTLALSQKMIQSMEILQMSSVELETYLKEFAVENPVVDIEDKSYEDHAGRDDQDFQRKMEWLADHDEQNRVYYSEEYSRDEEDKQSMGNLTDNKGEDLGAYLLSQVVMLDFSEKELEIAEYIIDLLDSKGYYTEGLPLIEEVFQISHAGAERILKGIQSLEPAGVAARDLSECLLLQMDRKKIDDPYARVIAQKYLTLLGKNQLPQIAKKMGITVDEVLSALEVIRSLNPKPGNSFSSRENLKYIIPDVTVVKLKDYFEILLNEYMYPKMSINSYYRSMLGMDTDKETRDYVGSKVKQAQWVMQCVSQRNSTLMKVSTCIVEAQQVFFAKGPGSLRPLKLADVAETIGMHESTVSRAVKDKYLQCSWGVYPMNYFFVGAASRKQEEDSASADQVKILLKEIIEGENHAKPYSDRILAEKLEEKGVKISRRTVAKYREAMGIRDASGRKMFG